MRYTLIILSCMIGLLPSCKKAELQKYTAGDAIYFNSIDSINYSFANQVGVLDHDTIFVPMQVLGEVKDYDRPIQLKAAAGSTAQANTHYKLPSAVVKANSNSLQYPILVMNTPDLITNTVRLELEVLENTDFPQGAGIINNGNHFTSFKINFNNSLIKPSYWASIQTYFGVYSNRKYKFMIDTLGFSDFNTTSLSHAEFLNLNGLMHEALQNYIDKNGSMIDENNNVITFPI